jgi:serine/threonine protein kinase
VVKQLGDGTYGNVWKAINRQTNEVVSSTALRMLISQNPAAVGTAQRRNDYGSESGASIAAVTYFVLVDKADVRA